MSLNKAIIIGRLGKDPETTHLDSGKQVTTLSVATSEYYKNQQGEKKEKSEWHRLVLWEKLSDIASQYLRKGDQAYFEGKLSTRSYDKDGVIRYTTEIVVSQLTLLGRKQTSNIPPPPSEDDDLPF